MADKNAKAAKNVPGKYYVDTNCINCGQCYGIAPDYFAEDGAGGVVVTAQPKDAAGIALCEQAISACPVEAIGDDGEG